MSDESKNPARAYTKDEVREKLLSHIRGLAEYWATVDRNSEKEKLDGLAFSILNIFDGTTMALPAFDLVLSPHESDKAYCIEQGENWYEPGMIVNDDTLLHEIYYAPNDKASHGK